MKFFLDTAHLPSLENAVKTGLIDGVTTNPTHLSKEGNAPELVKKIATLLYPRDVSVEVTEETPEAVFNQALAIAALSTNIVVKIPCKTPYLSVIDHLVSEGIPLNITLLFSSVQGLCMAKLGVEYISPFIGRLEDSDGDGIELIRDLKQLMVQYGFNTKILAASIRSVRHVHEVAQAGADYVTLPVGVFEKLLEHPLTDKGIEIFKEDWKKLGLSKFP